MAGEKPTTGETPEKHHTWRLYLVIGLIAAISVLHYSTPLDWQMPLADSQRQAHRSLS